MMERDTETTAKHKTELKESCGRWEGRTEGDKEVKDTTRKHTKPNKPGPVPIGAH